MPDFVTLSCPTCGGKLQITKDIERFACEYCGNEHFVKRGGGMISLIPIAEDIKGIKTGVDKTAAELAIHRIKKEIEELDSTYILKKRDKLINIKNIPSDFFGFGLPPLMNFVDQLYNRTGKTLYLRWSDNEGFVKLFTSLSDDDINYSITHWKEFWNPEEMKKSGIIYIHNILNDVKKLMDEIELPLHQKEAELEKMQQIINS